MNYLSANGRSGASTGANILDPNNLPTFVAGFQSIHMTIITTAGVSAGVLTFETSGDGVNWFAYQVSDASNPGAAISATLTPGASSARMLFANLEGTYVRCRISTSFVGGTVSASYSLSEQAFDSPSSGGGAAITNYALETGGNIATLVARTPALGFAAASAAQPVVLATDLSIVGPAAVTTGNNILASDSNAATDSSAYHSGGLWIETSAGISGGVLTFEQSATGTNWVALQVVDASVVNTNPVTTLTLAASTARLFIFTAMAGFIRVRVSTTVTGGTVQARALLSQQSFGAQTLNVQQATPGSLAMNLGQLGGTTPVTAGVAGTLAIGGNVAHSAATTANPVRVAGRVNTAVDTTLVANDTCDAFSTTGGQLLVKPYGLPETDWQFTGSITNATATAARAAGAAGVRNYVTAIQYQNTSATASEIQIQDGATPIWRGNAPASMALPAVIEFPTPLRGTAATALNVQLITTGTATFVNAQGYQAA